MKNTIIILGLAVVNCFGQTKNNFSFSVKQAVEFAMQNQNDIKNATITEELARKRVSETIGTGLPQINSSFDVKDFIEIPTQVAAANAFNPAAPPDMLSTFQLGLQYQATAGFDASQLLFSSDYIIGLKGSKVYVNLSTKNVQRTKIETAATVSKAYYMVLVSTERLKLMDANIARVKKTMDDTKALMDNGFVEKIDYDRITVTYNNLIVEQEKINRLLKVGTYLLKYQMGMDVNADLFLTDKLDDVKVDIGVLAQPDKFDYSKRIEYGIMETQFKLAKIDLKRQSLAFLPYAYAYGNLSGNAFRTSFTVFDTYRPWYPTALIGATIKMPIFSGFQHGVKVQEAKLNVQQAENNMDFIKKSIDLDLASSIANLTNAASSLENQKKNIKLAEDVVNVAKKKYDQGIGSNLELVTAETALQETQTNYYNALYDAIIAKIDFDKANGNLK